jgi:tetratricopeptide (TPR) repeat protein
MSTLHRCPPADGIRNVTLSSYSTARTLHEESLTISREIGDRSGIAGSLGCLGIVAHYEGDYPAARTLHENSLAISEAICDRRSIAGSLIDLGAVTESEGNNIDAIDLYTRSLTIQRDIGDRHGVAVSLSNLGSVALAMGDFPRARDHFEESLGILRDLGRLADIAWSLEGLAPVSQGEKQPERAAMLFQAAGAIRLTTGALLPPNKRPAHDGKIAALRQELGEEAFAAAWGAGQKLSLDEAVEPALKHEPDA